MRRDDVELVTEPVAAITPSGVRGADGTATEADVVVLCTGFETHKQLYPLDVRGRDGASIRDLWGQDDADAHLGITVAGFPNLFLTCGPGTVLGHGGSYITIAECQVRYIVEVRPATPQAASSVRCHGGSSTTPTLSRHVVWDDDRGGTPVTRTDTPSAWDERTTITTFLDYARATVRAKCEGVSEEHARSAPLPGSPLMTMSGLVSHVHWVEYSWFQVIYLGEEDHGPWTAEDPDREMRIGVESPIGELLDAYDAQCQRYRELVSSRDFDSRSARKGRHGEEFTLRWILLHLVEEIARHNGHLDILREMADGTRGD